MVKHSRKKTEKRRGPLVKKNTLKCKNKTKKQRGGQCFGTGYGKNAFDPNYSIYNTPLLSWFPYKPQ
jgi:hypothetical protein